MCSCPCWRGGGGPSEGTSGRAGPAGVARAGLCWRGLTPEAGKCKGVGAVGAPSSPVQGIVDRREDIGEAEPEHLKGDDAGHRDQCRDQPIFDGGRGACVVDQPNFPHDESPYRIGLAIPGDLARYVRTIGSGTGLTGAKACGVMIFSHKGTKTQSSQASSHRT